MLYAPQSHLLVRIEKEEEESEKMISTKPSDNVKATVVHVGMPISMNDNLPDIMVNDIVYLPVNAYINTVGEDLYTVRWSAVVAIERP